MITDKVGKVDTETGTGGTERNGLDGKVIDIERVIDIFICWKDIMYDLET